MRLLLALLLLGQDESIDPAKYSGPREARSIEPKPISPPSSSARAFLGVGSSASFEEGGIVLGEVIPDGPAAKAGLRSGDRVVRMAGRGVPDQNTLARLVRSHAPGDKVEVVLERDGEEKTLEVTLGTAPAGG